MWIIMLSEQTLHTLGMIKSPGIACSPRPLPSLQPSACIHGAVSLHLLHLLRDDREVPMGFVPSFC